MLSDWIFSLFTLLSSQIRRYLVHSLLVHLKRLLVYLPVGTSPVLLLTVRNKERFRLMAGVSNKTWGIVPLIRKIKRLRILNQITPLSTVLYSKIYLILFYNGSKISSYVRIIDDVSRFEKSIFLYPSRECPLARVRRYD